MLHEVFPDYPGSISGGASESARRVVTAADEARTPIGERISQIQRPAVSGKTLIEQSWRATEGSAAI